MWFHPNFDPVALSIGPLEVHWYGLMYLVGFIAAWWLGCYRARLSSGRWTAEQVSDLIFYGAIGVVLGGRIGYMVFYYYPSYGLSDPLALFKIWQGGMSFHGGLLGVLVAMAIYARSLQRSFFELTDFLAPLVPLGLAAGRLGNFINGELWGRVTDVSWAMIFPRVDLLPRHPSQLYECLLEGVVLFAAVWLYSSKPRPERAVSACFLVGYGLARITAECFREPDIQLGFLFGGVTMGQLLSVPLVLVGCWLLSRAYASHT